MLDCNRREERNTDYLEQYLPEPPVSLPRFNAYYPLSAGPGSVTTSAVAASHPLMETQYLKPWLRAYFEEVIWPHFEFYNERAIAVAAAAPSPLLTDSSACSDTKTVRMLRMNGLEEREVLVAKAVAWIEGLI
jgi:hypothetical protein